MSGYQYRFSIRFRDGRETRFFGEDYFNDKKMFWEWHQTQLRALCSELDSSSFPIVVTELETGQTTSFDEEKQLLRWLGENLGLETKR